MSKDNKKKYNIKDLMKNTDFEAQREDETLFKWQGTEEPKFSESPLPKEYIEWLSKQKGVDNRGVKGKGFFDDDELEFLENQKRDKPCENLKSKFFTEKDSNDYAYFDLDRMKEAMNQKGRLLPKFDTVEELREWLNSDCEDEDYE
jgi:hypothetical protein